MAMYAILWSSLERPREVRRDLAFLSSGSGAEAEERKGNYRSLSYCFGLGLRNTDTGFSEEKALKLKKKVKTRFPRYNLYMRFIRIIPHCVPLG